MTSSPTPAVLPANNWSMAGHISDMPEAWLRGAQFCTLPPGVEDGCRKELERRALLAEQEQSHAK